VIARLAAGSTVVLVSDPRLPCAATALASAANAAGVDAGALNVLHDDGLETIEAALADRAAAWARLAGSDPLLARVAARASEQCELSLWPVRSASIVIDESEDPALAARRAIETSLARLATLSGQLPGRTGRVLCPGRAFSRFSEELHAELDRNPDVARPVPLVERDALDALQEAWFLGLDEGATPLRGGEPWILDAEGETGGGPGASRRGEPRSMRVAPVVFTNVEPQMRLALFARAVPVLALLRVESAEAGRELARALDGTRG
jgi:aldehyde dehydrogenase (NAD+)